jgi:hypothetical protein
MPAIVKADIVVSSRIGPRGGQPPRGLSLAILSELRETEFHCKPSR